jgi:hypothetical protein
MFAAEKAHIERRDQRRKAEGADDQESGREQEEREGPIAMLTRPRTLEYGVEAFNDS